MFAFFYLRDIKNHHTPGNNTDISNENTQCFCKLHISEAKSLLMWITFFPQHNDTSKKGPQLFLLGSHLINRMFEKKEIAMLSPILPPLDVLNWHLQLFSVNSMVHQLNILSKLLKMAICINYSNPCLVASKLTVQHSNK